MSTDQVIVPVKLRALMARINRKLAHDGQVLKASRSNAEIENLGIYHVIDTDTNAVVIHHVDDLEKWVRHEFPDMLKPHERLEG